MNTVVSVASLASAAAVAAPSLSERGEENDPIFAAIARHRKAAMEWMRHVDIENELYRVIPADKRKNYHVSHRDDPDIGKNDDPRWTTARRAYWLASDQFDDASMALTDTAPSTYSGIFALIDYYEEFSRGGVRVSERNYSTEDLFPDQLFEDDVTDHRGRVVEGLPFAFWVMRNVRFALDRIKNGNVNTGAALVPLIKAVG